MSCGHLYAERRSTDRGGSRDLYALPFFYQFFVLFTIDFIALIIYNIIDIINL